MVYHHQWAHFIVANWREDANAGSTIARTLRPGGAVKIRPIRLPFSAKEKNGAASENNEQDNEVLSVWQYRLDLIGQFFLEARVSATQKPSWWTDQKLLYNWRQGECNHYPPFHGFTFARHMATARRIAFKEIAIIAALQCRFLLYPIFFAVGDEDGCQGRTSTCTDGKYIDVTIQHNSTQLNTCAEFPIPLHYKILSCFLLIVICELFARALGNCNWSSIYQNVCQINGACLSCTTLGTDNI